MKENNDRIRKSISKERMQSKKGETSAKGSYHLLKVNDYFELKISFEVKKVGFSGTGKGMILLGIYDKNFKLIHQLKPQNLTVGAKFPEGVNRKKWNETFSFTGELAKKIENEGSIIAFKVIAFSDSNGLPQSIDDWMKLIEDVIELLKLIDGGSKKKGDWKFIKIII